MEQQRCFIYAPPESGECPTKRQRIDETGYKAQMADQLRVFREIWSDQERRIQEILDEGNRATQEQIIDFISKPAGLTLQCIRTGLIIVGPSIASHGPFFESLNQRIKAKSNSILVVLTSGECANLKSLLKNLIKKAMLRMNEDEDEDESLQLSSSRHGLRFLDFDLGHLEEWQTRNCVERIVVAIQDSEAFDANVLTEMIDMFFSWRDRLPFVLLFGIATSAESFEDRLMRKSLRYLDGQRFDVTQSDEIIERLFSGTIASHDIAVRIGPILCRRILDRQKDHVQNLQDFSDGLKYAHMSHFYASCPSVFLKRDCAFSDMHPDAFEAVRNLPSFRRYVEFLVDNGQAQDARQLLESDEFLFESVVQHIQVGQDLLGALSSAARILHHLRSCLSMSPHVALSSLWIQAVSGEMIGSPVFRETMLVVKKVSSDKLVQILEAFLDLNEPHFILDIQSYNQRLEILLEGNTSATPLRSQHDIRNDNFRTTVVAQKVQLSKFKATLSEKDKTYSELVGDFHDAMEQYFKTAFIIPGSLFLSEVLIYDLKSPHIEVFQPKPRFAIERALALPHDYLGCECCDTEAGYNGNTSLSSTQPATALLYQLYLESGALINVSDLWSAFNAIAGNENEDSESLTMALFQRALSELKYLGLVKPSRKKTDHIAKVMWRGL